MVLQTTTPPHIDRPTRVMADTDTDTPTRQDGGPKRLCSANDGGDLVEDASSASGSDTALSDMSSASASDLKDGSKSDESPPPAMRGADYPDFGWGWLMCGAAFVAQFVCHGFQLASGVMHAGIQQHVNVTATQSVWMGCGSYATYLLVTPLSIAVCRHTSARMVAVVGGLICSVGFLLMSLSTNYGELLFSMCIVIGVGTAASLGGAHMAVATYSDRRRECAEMLALSGMGVGMALAAVTVKQIIGAMVWARALQSLALVSLLTVVAAAFYCTADLHRPPGHVMEHVTNEKKRRRFRYWRNYVFDTRPLRMRVVHVLMAASALTAFGTYVPFALLPMVLAQSAINADMTLLIMVLFGVSLAFGSLLNGVLTMRSSAKCMIARQYFYQMTSCGCGVLLMLFTIVEGLNASILFVCGYGLLCGGLQYSLKVYILELVGRQLADGAWGAVTLAQAMPTLLGSPIVARLNSASGGREGFVFAGACMVAGSVVCFLLPLAARHRSNYKVLQRALQQPRLYQDDILMLNADEISPKLIELNDDHKSDDHKSDEDHWSHIEAMHPVSHSTKVADFLFRSNDERDEQECRNECDNDMQVGGRHTSTSGLLATDASENELDLGVLPGAAFVDDCRHNKKCCAASGHRSKVRRHRLSESETNTKMTTV